MKRQKLIVKLIESVIGTRITGFYDLITRDTVCVVTFRDNTCEIVLTRPCGRSRVAVHADEICEVLIENGFSVSAPVSFEKDPKGKPISVGTGQRLVIENIQN